MFCREAKIFPGSALCDRARSTQNFWVCAFETAWGPRPDTERNARQRFWPRAGAGIFRSTTTINRARAAGVVTPRRSSERRDGRTAHLAANAPTRRGRPGALTPRLVRVARPARRGKDDRHQADVVGGTASPIDAKRGRPAAGAGWRRPGRLEAHVSRLFPARRRALATTQGPKERQGVLLQRRHEGERLGRSETRGAGDGGGEGRGSIRCRSIRCRSIRCRSIR